MIPRRLLLPWRVPPLIHVAVCWIVAAALGSIEPPSSSPLTLATLLALAVGVVSGVISTGDRAHAYRVAVTLGLAGISLAGVLQARAAREEALVCRTALAHVLADSGTVLAVFDDHVQARNAARSRTGESASRTRRSARVATPSVPSRSRGVVRGAAGALSRCRVPVMVAVSSGRARAGQWMSLQGTVLTTERGLRVTGAITPLAHAERDWRRAVRARTGDLIDRDFKRNAPLVRALLIADQDGIDPAVRDRFADAGLVHMLSISGLHVAIIAGSLLTLASAMRLSQTAAFGAALVVIVLYVTALGAPPPAVRSAVMLAVVGLSQRLQRPTHPWTALALGAVIPTVQPAVVLDLGWQLSVSGMAALVAARALLRRLRLAEAREHPPRIRRALRWLQGLSGWRYTAVRELVTGVVATLVTAPLIAWTFGRVSVVAPLSNIAAGPLVAFAQPALFLALVASPWPTVSGVIADASMPPLALLDLVARISAAVPHAALHLAPTAIGAICAAVASAAAVRATASRRWAPAALVACGALTMGIWLPTFAGGSGRLELHVMDVGQGDALGIRTPKGRWVLVDAGRRWDGGDAGRRTVVPYVRRVGGDVAAFVMSHAHDDHVGGAASIIQALEPERWWEPAFVTTSEAYRRALETARHAQTAWHRVSPGDRWQLDGIEVRVLAPDSAWTAAQTDANETSVVLRISYRDVAFLLTGDAEAEEENWMLEHIDPALLRADVLKLGHHGSRTSSRPPFVDAVAPRLGVVSVGAGNTYRHPSTETLETFTARGIPLLRTDLEGTIVIVTDGQGIEVRAGGQRWNLPALASPYP